MVDGIITEDSDLLVFGCRNVVFKLDGDGHCVSIKRDNFTKVASFPMHGWSDRDFRRMAMLAGCDYLPSIPGIGIKTAHKLLRRYKTVERLLQSLRLEGSHAVPDAYAAEFSRAELAFVYQRVYDPRLGRLVTLSAFDGQDEAWIGVDLAVEVAKGIALGDLHPETKEPIVDMYPDYKPLPNARPGRVVTKTPTPRKQGPMDAFVKRTTPSQVHPKPIGTTTSGPARLSDLPLYSSRAQTQAQAAPSWSKFFSKPAVKKQSVCEREVETARSVMVWEEEEVTIPSSPASVRSPSPFTPPKARVAASGSPAGSSASSPKFETQLTSPGPSQCSSPAPASPQPEVESIPLESIGSTVVESIQPKQSQRSTLVPATPPPHLSTGSISSDSMEIVTPPDPIPVPVTKSKSKANARRWAEDVEEAGEEDEEEKEQEKRTKRAKVIAAGWRAKYALDFPQPRSTRIHSAKSERASATGPRTPGTPTVPKVLSARSVNVPLQTETSVKNVTTVTGVKTVAGSTPVRLVNKAADTPTKTLKDASCALITPVKSTETVPRTCSSLEKFRFNGKVDYPV